MTDVINVVVGGAISIVNPPDLVRAELVDEFSLPNPEYRTRKMLGMYLDETPRTITFASCNETGVVVPRGEFKRVKSVLKENQVPWRVIDKRSGGNELTFDKKLPYEPREYQEISAAAIKKHLQGIIVLPCGTGKTYVAMIAITKIAKSTLVIVPTKDLMYQWEEDAMNSLGIQAALIGDGKRERGDLTIAILDSLNNENDTDFLSSFGFVVHDECHRSCAKRNQNVMRKIPARWRLGLTATKMREDGLEELIDWTFGNTLVEYGLRSMVDKGYLLAPRIIEVKTKFEFEYLGLQTRKMDETHKAIVRDGPRTALIVSLIHQCIMENENSSVLILANRIEFCDLLAERFVAIGLNAKSVTSKASKKKRKAAISELRDGSLQIMVATSLADEGLNIPRLSHVVLAFPEKAKSRTIQRLGRVMRPFDNKFPRLYDIVDNKVEMLKKRWYKRRSVYKKLELMV